MILWTGLCLAVLACLLSLLNRTALPAVVDTPLATVAVASLAALVLIAGVRQETRRAAAVRRGRLTSGAAAILAVLGIAAVSAQERFFSYRTHEVRFSNEAVDLAGTLYEPRTQGPHPAVVFIHGSGPETRRAHAFFAKLFARHGFAALAYDKRGSGQSGGRLYAADYRDYAMDALAAVRSLGETDGIDGGCIGLIGFSEGEWVVPLAASVSEAIAFLIVVAPSGVSPAAQVNAEIALRLRAREYSSSDVERALALNERVLDYQRTGLAPERLAEDLRQASAEPWFRDAEDIPDSLYPADLYRWWRSVMDFAPGLVWEQVKVPVLLLKGGRDPKSEPERARREIEAALTRGGNPGGEFIVFPDGDHSLLRWPLGERVPPPVFASGYLDTMIRWARDRTCARR